MIEHNFPGLDLYCIDPAQHLDRDLSDLSVRRVKCSDTRYKKTAIEARHGEDVPPLNQRRGCVPISRCRQPDELIATRY